MRSTRSFLGALASALALLACDVDVRLGARTLDGAAADGGLDADASAVADSASDGGCVDVLSDPQNCGRCGHSCQGRACVGGACATVVLAQSLPRPDWLAVDATHVYFTCDGKSGQVGQENEIDKVDIAGTTVTTLRKEAAIPAGIAVDATNVYWTQLSGTSSSVLKIDKLGTPASWTKIADAPLSDARGLALGGNELYWAGNTVVRRALTTDNTTFGTDWATGLVGAQGVALSPTRLYVTSGAPLNWTVVERSSKSVVFQGNLAGTAFDVFVEGASAFVVTGVAAYMTDVGGLVTAILDQGFTGGVGIVADKERIYWSTLGDIRSRRRDLQGSVETVLKITGAAHLALDATWLYFTLPLSGEVRKIAR